MGPPRDPKGSSAPPSGPGSQDGLDVNAEDDLDEGTKKKGRARKPKEDKPPKEPKERKVRAYNRKKKPVPGALAEDDIDKVDIPPDIAPPENGELEDDILGAVVEPKVDDAIPEPDESQKRKPGPRLKSNTPRKPKPNKTL